ncbi:GPKOW protein, partial [Nicator chloris]|nr:GPKOW protein [Nicator chloris]
AKDVLSRDTCTCQMDNGHLVEGLQEASLETVVPWDGSNHVMLVLGEHAGQVGQLLEQKLERGRALVQMGWDPQMLPLPYDSICHYLGGSED